VSLISNYRSQFNSILKRMSFARLLDRLRKREASEGVAAGPRAVMAPGCQRAARGKASIGAWMAHTSLMGRAARRLGAHTDCRRLDLRTPSPRARPSGPTTPSRDRAGGKL
jgi:hypothetical protein